MEAYYRDDKGYEWNFYTFEVSIAPRGWVTVWLRGSAGQREICSFQADEAPNWDYHKVFPNRSVSREEMRSAYLEDMYGFVQKEIAENRVPYDYWKRLSKKYRWKLVTNDPGFEVYHYSADLINIERYYHQTEPGWLTHLNEKAIPNELFFLLRHTKDPLRYKVSIELVKAYDPDNKDEESQVYYQMTRTRYLMDLFEKFYAEASDDEVSLMVEFDDAMSSVEVKLKTATKEQVIEDCKLIGIWDSDRSKNRW